jgi:Outer membrane protein and related peptidoglycan-associated (lipo)proteins
MYKLSVFIILPIILFSGCSAYKYSTNVHSKPDKDIMSSNEILLTSLFFATTHTPEEEKTDIAFFEQDKSALSKEARNKIAVFAQEILTYEDYRITVEGYADISENNDEKLAYKRAESVKKSLIKNGIDKDKIEITGMKNASNISQNSDEHSESVNNMRAVIDAELW